MRLPARPRLLVGLLIAAHVAVSVGLIAALPWLDGARWTFPGVKGGQPAAHWLKVLLCVQAILLLALGWLPAAGRLGRAVLVAAFMGLCVMAFWAESVHTSVLFGNGRPEFAQHLLYWSLESLLQLAIVLAAAIYLRRRGYELATEPTYPTGTSERWWQYRLTHLLLFVTLVVIAIGAVRIPTIFVAGQYPRWQLANLPSSEGLALVVPFGPGPPRNSTVLMLNLFTALPAVSAPLGTAMLLGRELPWRLTTFLVANLAVVLVGVVAQPLGGKVDFFTHVSINWNQAMRMRQFDSSIVALAAFQIAIVLVTLLVLRLAGYRLVRRERIERESAV
jgi:hypothetical protein